MLTRTFLFTTAVPALSLLLSLPLFTLAACQSPTAPPFDEPLPEGLQLGLNGGPCVIPGDMECAEGYVCRDVPRDGCVPLETPGGCPGTCEPDKLACLDPDRDYVSRDPDLCAAISFLCVAPLVPFFDSCGCGCEVPPLPPGERCGANVCAPGEYCCNRSCGICAPLGGSCILIACE